jgi:SET domain-containing protein
MARYNFALKRTVTGLGLFTLQRIPPGKRIIEYLGPVITSEVRDKKGGKYLFEIDEQRAIDGSARSNLARYINHSCRPNAEAFVTGIRIWIWSKKSIEAGDEITIHYGKEYIEEHIKPKGCKCKQCFTKRTSK